MVHTNIYRKVIFRRPIRTLTLLLLLAAITYAFVAHAAEGLLVTNEIAKLEKYYQPIGTLTAESGDVREGAELIAECPYVELNDVRGSCHGALVGLQNSDNDGSLLTRFDEGYETFVTDVVFLGTLLEKEYVERERGPGGYYEMTFQVNEAEAGFTEYIPKRREVHVRCLPGLPIEYLNEYFPLEQDEAFVEEYETLEPGRRYLLRAYYRESAGINATGAARGGLPGSVFILDTLLPAEGSRYFFEVPEGGQINYEAPELEGLSDYLDFLRHNQSVMMFYGTENMSKMPDCQEVSRKYYLTDGRWLNGEDEQNQNRVCVVHNYFARLRGLEVGDKIRVSMENTNDGWYGSGYALWDTWKNWESCDRTEEEFEIVGIYEDLELNDSFLAYYSLYVFIPNSCIPQGYSALDYDPKVWSSMYSFVLEKPADRQRFMEEYKDALDELGIQVQFVENNADNFAISAGQLQNSTVLSILLFGAVQLLVVLLLCGLYLVQRRREFAVARALGVSAVRAASGMVASFGWIGLPAVLLGGILGWQRTASQAEEILQPLESMRNAEQVSEGSALSVTWLAGILAAILLTAAVILLVGAFLITRKPVLVLLQGGAAAGRGGNRKSSRAAEDTVPSRVGEKNKGISAGKNTGMEKTDAIPMEEGTEAKRNCRKAKLGYVGKHQVRSAGKSVLVLALGVGAMLTFGWMYRTIQSNLQEVDRIYESTVIEGEIVKANSGTVSSAYGGGVIPPRLVEEIAESGLVSEVYTEETVLLARLGKFDENDKVEYIEEDIPMIGIYDWDAFAEGTGKNLTFRFLEGYNGGAINGVGYVAIVSESQLALLGVELGDEIAPSVSVDIDGGTLSQSIDFTVVGSYDGAIGNGVGGDAVLVPAGRMHKMLPEGADYYDLVAKITFDSTKNRELMEREDELKELVEGWKHRLVPLRLLIWDEELYAAIEPMERTLSLFGILYPVAMAVFFVLGFGFQFLVLLLRRREAAVMRVLGNSAGTVRKLLAAEQIWLCVIGILVGVMLLLILGWQPAFRVWQAAGLYLLGSAAGTVAGSIAVTGKRPLELLQVHE
ncbi:MAG: ABC transporter permease [Roseburia sp.]|nr:ABC transporter permease [Roseburia sp.]